MFKFLILTLFSIGNIIFFIEIIKSFRRYRTWNSVDAEVYGIKKIEHIDSSETVANAKYIVNNISYDNILSHGVSNLQKVNNQKTIIIFDPKNPNNIRLKNINNLLAPTSILIISTLLNIVFWVNFSNK